MKSFSLEGAETLISLLDLVIEKLAVQGIREIVMSMSHRGRLNVLANILGKSFQAIFRVNGEAPEAVAQVVDLALDFRAAFRRDVVIDMSCFRRWGRNEGDEPGFTRPQMVRAIEQRPTVREGFLKHLLQLGKITSADTDEIARLRQDTLERGLSLARR